MHCIPEAWPLSARDCARKGAGRMQEPGSSQGPSKLRVLGCSGGLRKGDAGAKRKGERGSHKLRHP